MEAKEQRRGRRDRTGMRGWGGVEAKRKGRGGCCANKNNEELRKGSEGKRREGKGREGKGREIERSSALSSCLTSKDLTSTSSSLYLRQTPQPWLSPQIVFPVWCAFSMTPGYRLEVGQEADMSVYKLESHVWKSLSKMIQSFTFNVGIDWFGFVVIHLWQENGSNKMYKAGAHHDTTP